MRHPHKVSKVGSIPTITTNIAVIAQSVEHFLGKEEVDGSIPSNSTKHGEVAQTVERPDLKGRDGGSRPPLSTNFESLL